MTLFGFAVLIAPVVGPTLGGWPKGWRFWRFGRAPSRSGSGRPSAATLLIASALPAPSSSSRNLSCSIRRPSRFDERSNCRSCTLLG
jgi:hypothetical protein